MKQCKILMSLAVFSTIMFTVGTPEASARGGNVDCNQQRAEDTEICNLLYSAGSDDHEECKTRAYGYYACCLTRQGNANPRLAEFCTEVFTPYMKNRESIRRVKPIIRDMDSFLGTTDW